MAGIEHSVLYTVLNVHKI